ncbi:MAG: hypothetical protein R2747_02720 [Pyrinomonadaceae bacterium]
MESRFYPGVKVDFDRLMAELRVLFDDNFQVQNMKLGNVTVLQARKSSTLLDITGLSTALTVKVYTEDGGTKAEIGMQKWLDKAAIATVTYLLFLPLIALPIIGAYSQYKLTERAWQVIENHIAQKASV